MKRMASKYPRKGEKHTFVVRAKWRYRMDKNVGAVCGICVKSLMDRAETLDIVVPDLGDDLFFAPPEFLDRECMHPGSPHFGEPVIISPFDRAFVEQVSK